MKTIIVTGSVGSGKTTLSKRLSKLFNFGYVDITKLVKENNLSSGFDKKRKCEIIDINRINNFLTKLIKGSKNDLLIDSHLSHYLPKKFVDLCIVTKCSLKKLQKRLENRGYDKEKIRENIDVEVFDVCLSEAKALNHNILVINTTQGIKMDEISKKVKVMLNEPAGRGTKRNNKKK